MDLQVVCGCGLRTICNCCDCRNFVAGLPLLPIEQFKAAVVFADRREINVPADRRQHFPRHRSKWQHRPYPSGSSSRLVLSPAWARGWPYVAGARVEHIAGNTTGHILDTVRTEHMV